MSNLGIRSNNPGNIRHSDAFTWMGETGVNEKGFCIFDTMENGYRALCRTLMAYQSKHGLRTIRGMISRWAPPSENDTEAYIKYVCGAAGVADDFDLDILTNPSNLATLAHAISEQENGRADVAANVTAATIVAGAVDALRSA